MSRLHTSPQKNDLFESYLNTMLKNGKRIERPRNEITRLSRDKSINRNNNNNQLVVSRPIVKITAKNDEIVNKPSSEELVHKEVFNNNMATVEVTVRTVAPKGAGIESKSNSEEKREPWGKLLGNRKSDDNVHGTFGNFDPLRTLHFLSKELQMKMHSLCPSDPNVQQIVSDMQNAIHRLPPDVLSELQSKHNLFGNNVGDTEVPIRIKKSNPNINKVEKQTQTIIIGDGDTKKLQQQLEESAAKLEASCKEMEELCKTLRIERDDLETMLSTERETVETLRRDLNEAVVRKDEKFNKEINTINSERDYLKTQVTDLQTLLETKACRSTEDLRTLVDGLKNKQLNTEQENTSIRNELTIMKLEKDKLNVLLESRDKQLKELRYELECIQQLVTTQLLEVKLKPTFSTTSSISSASTIWNMQGPRSKYGKSVHELFMNNDIMRKMLMDKELKITDSVATTTTIMPEETKASNMRFKLDDMQVIPQKEKPSMIKMGDQPGPPLEPIAKPDFIKSPTGKLVHNGQKYMSQMTFSEAGMSSDDFFKSAHPSIQDMFAEIKRQAFMTVDAPIPSNSRTTQKDSTNHINNNSIADSRTSESS